MNSEHHHCSNARLQEFLDGVLPDPVRMEVAEHLASCSACRRSAGLIRRLDDALRTLPHEAAGAEITRSVMERLGIAPPPDVAYRLLTLAGAAVGLTILAGVMLVVFALTGVLDVGLGAGGIAPVSEWWGTTLGIMSRVAADAGELGGKYLPFLSLRSGLPVWVFAAVVVGMLGAADYLLHRRVQRH